MGNETSSNPGDRLTPQSDFEDEDLDEDMFSNRSDSRPWSSTPPSFRDSPVTPPEPDLSHLTDEERAQIAAVLSRAKQLEQDEDDRIRALESDVVIRKAELEGICPVCESSQLYPGEVKAGEQDICADCERLICKDCGTYVQSLSSKLQEWLCHMCQKRRHIVMSSGGWFHGYRQKPCFKDLDTLPAVYSFSKKALERTTSLSHYEDFKEEEQKQTRYSLARQGSLPSCLNEADERIVDTHSLEILRDQITASQRSLTESGDSGKGSIDDESSTPNGKKSSRSSDDEDSLKRQQRPRSLSLTRQRSSEESESPPESPLSSTSDRRRGSDPDRHRPINDVRDTGQWRDDSYNWSGNRRKDQRDTIRVVVSSHHSDSDGEEEGKKLTPRPSPVSPHLNLDNSGECLRSSVPSDSDYMRLGATDATSCVIDLATYAAAISSNTAQLTNLSASPTSFLANKPPAYESRVDLSPDDHSSNDSLEVVSPCYYEDDYDVELADPSEKSVDYQNTIRQKVKPPTTDWSPVTDLSPIEEAEFEESAARFEETFTPISSLKRYQNFEDISELEARLKDYEEVGRLNLNEVQELTDRVREEELGLKQVDHDEMEHSVLDGGKPVRRTLPQPEMISNAISSAKSTGSSIFKHFQTYLTFDNKKPDVETHQSSNAIHQLDSQPSRATQPDDGTTIIAPTSQSSRPVDARIYISSPSVEEDTKKVISAKDMKAKPNPLRLEHIEAEEENGSPHYKVMKSPLTPESQSLLHSYKDFDRTPEDSDNAFPYPSPVTPPDSDASPPKPQSPSVPDMVEAPCRISPRQQKGTTSSGSSTPGSGDAETRRNRRKLPQLPQESPYNLIKTPEVMKQLNDIAKKVFEERELKRWFQFDEPPRAPDTNGPRIRRKLPENPEEKKLRLAREAKETRARQSPISRDENIARKDDVGDVHERNRRNQDELFENERKRERAPEHEGGSPIQTGSPIDDQGRRRSRNNEVSYRNERIDGRVQGAGVTRVGTPPESSGSTEKLDSRFQRSGTPEARVSSPDGSAGRSPTSESGRGDRDNRRIESRIDRTGIRLNRTASLEGRIPDETDRSPQERRPTTPENDSRRRAKQVNRVELESRSPESLGEGRATEFRSENVRRRSREDIDIQRRPSTEKLEHQSNRIGRNGTESDPSRISTRPETPEEERLARLCEQPDIQRAQTPPARMKPICDITEDDLVREEEERARRRREERKQLEARRRASGVESVVNVDGKQDDKRRDVRRIAEQEERWRNEQAERRRTEERRMEREESKSSDSSDERVRRGDGSSRTPSEEEKRARRRPSGGEDSRLRRASSSCDDSRLQRTNSGDRRGRRTSNGSEEITSPAGIDGRNSPKDDPRRVCDNRSRRVDEDRYRRNEENTRRDDGEDKTIRRRDSDRRLEDRTRRQDRDEDTTSDRREPDRRPVDDRRKEFRRRESEINIDAEGRIRRSDPLKIERPPEVDDSTNQVMIERRAKRANSREQLIQSMECKSSSRESIGRRSGSREGRRRIDDVNESRDAEKKLDGAMSPVERNGDRLRSSPPKRFDSPQRQSPTQVTTPTKTGTPPQLTPSRGEVPSRINSRTQTPPMESTRMSGTPERRNSPRGMETIITSTPHDVTRESVKPIDTVIKVSRETARGVENSPESPESSFRRADSLKRRTDESFRTNTPKVADDNRRLRGRTERETKRNYESPQKERASLITDRTSPPRVQPVSFKTRRDELVIIYGVSIPKTVKTMHDLMCDELKLVTYQRRRQLEELTEIKLLELQLEQIRELEEKQRLCLQEKLLENKARLEELKQRRATTLKGSDRKSPQSVSSPTAAQIRRSRHRRQNSDPALAKFSPIEEYRDIDKAIRSRSRDDNLAGYTLIPSRPLPVRQAPPSRSYKVNESGMSRLCRSSEHLKEDYLEDRVRFLSSSQSERSLLAALESGSRFADQQPHGTYYHSPERDIAAERRIRELEAELQYAKEQYQYTVSGENDPYSVGSEIWELENEEIRSRYDVTDSSSKNRATSRSSSHVEEFGSAGIIKPIEEFDGRSRRDRFLRDAPCSAFTPIQKPPRHEIYSSSEYLAHKNESGSSPHMGFDQFYADPRDMSPSTRVQYSSANTGRQPRDARGSRDLRDSRDARDPRGSRDLRDPRDPRYQPQHPSQRTNQSQAGPITKATVHQEVPLGNYRDFTPIRVEIDPGSPARPNGVTPAMPLLDDVTSKSRRRIHAIQSSRPTSGDYDNYYLDQAIAHDFHELHGEGSENSYGDSDEPIMEHMTEGGVTIQKRKVGRTKSLEPAPKKYRFPYKRILITRDIKDRSVKGNGLGMKIVGGKCMPGSEETGAFVQAIYAGGVANQLHGELQEGDQILEWNGIDMIGRTYEEVQWIISQPNSEIEIVVKPANMKLTIPPSESKASTAESTIKSESSPSPYDNLAGEQTLSDTDDYDSFTTSQQGVDPAVLAAQLEGIKERMSPGISPTASIRDLTNAQLSPFVRTPQSATPRRRISPNPNIAQTRPLTDCNSARSDSQSDVQSEVTMGSRNTSLGGNENSIKSQPSPRRNEGKVTGEIQLQLDYDDYDESMSIRVIQARDLVINQQSTTMNPYVRMYLLPGRGPDNRRKTNYIADSRTPEWHHTFVFVAVPRAELKNRSLEVSVWNCEKGKTHDCIGETLLYFSDDQLLCNQPLWFTLRESTGSNGSDNSLSTSDSLGSGHKNKKRPFSKPSMEDVQEASARRGKTTNAKTTWKQYFGLPHDNEMFNVLTLVLSGGCCGRSNKAAMNQVDRLSPKPRRRNQYPEEV